jgi:DNA-binding NtrC family response regulator
MNTNKTWNVLYIADDKSMFASSSQMFNELFNKVDTVLDGEKALELIDSNDYDILISDISEVFVDGIKLLKSIKHRKPKLALFALVTEKDSDKLFGIAEQGIHVFELTPNNLILP